MNKRTPLTELTIDELSRLARRELITSDYNGKETKEQIVNELIRRIGS